MGDGPSGPEREETMSKVRGGAIVAAVLAVAMLASITEATAAEPATA